MAMAVATPATLPLPMVAESAVVKAWKGEMSPVPSSELSRFRAPPEINLRAFLKFVAWTNLVFQVRSKPTPQRRIIVQTPQTMSDKSAVSSEMTLNQSIM